MRTIWAFSDTVLELQRKMEVLQKSCYKWGLNVNLDKAEVLMLRNGGKLNNETSKLGDMSVKVFTNYSYLGKNILRKIVLIENCLDIGVKIL